MKWYLNSVSNSWDVSSRRSRLSAVFFCCVLDHQKGHTLVGWLTDWVSYVRTHNSPHRPLLSHRWSPDYKYQLLWEGGGQTTTLVLHAGCRDGSIFKWDRIRRMQEKTRSRGVNVKKQTVAFLSIAARVLLHWMNYHPLRAPARLQ